MEAVCLSLAWRLAWRLSVSRHGSHTGIYTLALTHWHSHTGMGAVCLLLAWRLSVYCHGLGWHGGCLFIAMAYTLAFKEVVLGIGMVQATVYTVAMKE